MAAKTRIVESLNERLGDRSQSLRFDWWRWQEVVDVFLNILLDHIEIAPDHRRRPSRELIYIVDKRNSGIFVL